MLIRLQTVDEMQATIHRLKATKKTLGFVATMGCLHAGHEALIKRSTQENDITIVSIFVNPTQFNRTEDLQHYPRDLDTDQQRVEQWGGDYIFTPSEEALYIDHYQYKLSENHISQRLEGRHRPGHFEGVLTIVLKLLQIITPDRAYFGEKDYQQYLLIKGMAAAFFLPTHIIPCPTIRDANGLAYSSRNTRLSAEQRKFAAHFPQLLASTSNCDTIKQKLIALGFEVDYIEDYDGRRYAAVFLAGVRLIDNRAIPTC